jgi:hypothetical protein
MDEWQERSMAGSMVENGTCISGRKCAKMSLSVGVSGTKWDAGFTGILVI